MTDYERTITRETTAVDPGGAPATGSSVRTTERAYAPAGPSGAATAVRVITFVFGILLLVLGFKLRGMRSPRAQQPAHSVA